MLSPRIAKYVYSSLPVALCSRRHLHSLMQWSDNMTHLIFVITVKLKENSGETLRFQTKATAAKVSPQIRPYFNQISIVKSWECITRFPCKTQSGQCKPNINHLTAVSSHTTLTDVLQFLLLLLVVLFHLNVQYCQSLYCSNNQLFPLGINTIVPLVSGA